MARDATNASGLARQVVEETLKGLPPPQCFLVISSVEAVLNYRHQTKAAKRHVRNKLKNAFDLIQSVSDAYSRHGTEAAKAILPPAVEDRIVWWCDTRREFEEVLTGIYSRLLATSHHDAFDYGCRDSLAWVRIWVDGR